VNTAGGSSDAVAGCKLVVEKDGGGLYDVALRERNDVSGGEV
jgi:hypothetical protein